MSTIRDGVRAALPFGVAAVILGISFGVVAEPVMGGVAAVVMSAIVFAGAAQFAAVAVLAAGGGAAAAIVAGILLNLRFLPMGAGIGPSLRGGPVRRALEGQAVVDASWAIASRGGGRYDREVFLGATLAQYPAWVLGTAIGVLWGDVLGDPEKLGLDAIFPAFFLALLLPELRDRTSAVVAVLGAAIAISLVSFVPAGVPILAASLAALVGLRRA